MTTTNKATIQTSRFILIIFIFIVTGTVACYSQDNSCNKMNADKDVMRSAGFWSAKIIGDDVNIQFKREKIDERLLGNNFPLLEFTSLPKVQSEFSLTREAGTVKFIGKFDENIGKGTYKFIADKALADYLVKEGIDISEDRGMLSFFVVDLKKSFIEMLKDFGYTNFRKKDLIAIGAVKVDAAFIYSLNEAGFKNIPLDDLVTLKALNVDNAYINNIRKAGYQNISLHQVIDLKAQGIDSKNINELRNQLHKHKKGN